MDRKKRANAHRMQRARRACLLLVPFAIASFGARGFGQSGAGISTDVEIAGLLDEIEASSAKQERFEREVGELTSRDGQLRADLRTQVRALYRITRSGLAPLAGGMDAVRRHVARVKRLRHVVEREALALGTLESRQKTLRAERGKVSQALELARSRLATLQSAPRSSGRELASFVRQSASSSSPGASIEGSEFGVHLVDSMSLHSFESERGSLASPVMGDVQIAAGRRAESDGPGLQFQAPVGTPVRAVAAGRVAFSDRYGSYGRLVILDHGGGYYTVYGGLGTVEVRVGDDLSRQARIGSIGNEFTPSALFFEVRKGTRTLEPRSWLGL